MAKRSVDIRKLLAELFIVVVGILIALGIDQAVSERADRVLEREYLISLRADFLETVEWLDGFGGEVNQRKESELLFAQSVIDGGQAAQFDSVRFAYALAIGGFHPVLPVPRATFDDLTGTGNLRVIRDAGLRRRLVDFYAWVELFGVHESAMVERGALARTHMSAILAPELTAQLSDLGWNGGGDAWPPLADLTVPPSLRNAVSNSSVVAAARTTPGVSATLSGLIADVYLQRQQFKLVGTRARAVLSSLEDLVAAL